jgi:hypothetical protein
MLVMANREQTRAKEQPTPAHTRGEGKRTDARAAGTSEAPRDVWEPIPGTSLFSRNGVGVYERLTEALFLQVDDVDAAGVVQRFREAFLYRKEPADIEASIEQEATDILARMDRELVVEEALTQQLLRRYGLAS